MAIKPVSTKQFVDLSDIRGILVFLKDGSLRSVIEIESINFELKSSDEQIATLRGFQDFLNALDFDIQILVHSRKLNIDNYLNFLDTTFAKIDNELLRMQSVEYKRFVKGLSDLANIMDKRFFITVPYYPMQNLQASRGPKNLLKGFLGNNKATQQISDEELQKYQADIDQRLSLIIAALTPLGLQAKVLGQDELAVLFSSYYNPPPVTRK